MADAHPERALTPDVITTIAELRTRVLTARRAGAAIGLVPTMGALHDGHASLAARARHDNGCVVASIFVNPLQFDRKDDLEAYPRTLEADVAALGALGVDLVFAPSPEEMYPVPPEMGIDVGRLGDHLCGRFRPGHFRGVATVVMKLLQIVQPDRAYFGEKDAQQLAIIRRLVADFNLPVDIVGMPTLREADGLALSSRNRRLLPEQRPLALALIRALSAARHAIEAGETSTETVRALASREVPSHDAVRLEYLEVVDPVNLQPLERISGPIILAGALWVGSVRLIDNLQCGPNAS